MKIALIPALLLALVVVSGAVEREAQNATTPSVDARNRLATNTDVLVTFAPGFRGNIDGFASSRFLLLTGWLVLGPLLAIAWACWWPRRRVCQACREGSPKTADGHSCAATTAAGA
jgi:hypothetical protein